MEKMVKGSIVYCQDTCQVYVVVGFNSNCLEVKNLTNLKFPIRTISRNQVIVYPETWKNRDWYEKLAQHFI